MATFVTSVRFTSLIKANPIALSVLVRFAYICRIIQLVTYEMYPRHISAVILVNELVGRGPRQTIFGIFTIVLAYKNNWHYYILLSPFGRLIPTKISSISPTLSQTPFEVGGDDTETRCSRSTLTTGQRDVIRRPIPFISEQSDGALSSRNLVNELGPGQARPPNDFWHFF